MLATVPEEKQARYTSPAVTSAALFRRAILRKRYTADGGRASIGSSARNRRTSAANALAVS